MEYDLLENREFEDWLVKLRREFHRYPEPGWLEYRTTASYDAPVEDVKAALLRAAEHPLRMQEMQPIARVNGYGESAIEYVLFLWIRPKDYMDVYYDVLENVKREFDASGIEMTYPHINVHHIS